MATYVITPTGLVNKDTGVPAPKATTSGTGSVITGIGAVPPPAKDVFQVYNKDTGQYVGPAQPSNKLDTSKLEQKKDFLDVGFPTLQQRQEAIQKYAEEKKQTTTPQPIKLTPVMVAEQDFLTGVSFNRTATPKEIYQQAGVLGEPRAEQIRQSEVRKLETELVAKYPNITPTQVRETINKTLGSTIQPTVPEVIKYQEPGYNIKASQRDLQKINYERPVKQQEQRMESPRFVSQEKQTISQQEYESKVKESLTKAEKETSFEELVIKPSNLRTMEVLTKDYSKEGPILGTALFAKDWIGNVYDLATDIGGFTISGAASGVPPSYVQSLEKQVTKEGILNPKEAVIFELPQREEQYVSSKISDMFVGKQAIESSLFLAGGVPYTFATIGSIGRAKTLEETALPIAFGVAGRIATPYIAPLFSKAVGGLNAKVGELGAKLFIGKQPVLENVLVANPFANIFNESTVAKGLLLAGAGAEVFGIGFVPNEYKREYVRQTGLFNAITPLAYRGTDIGIAVGKYAGIKALSPLGGYDVYTAQDLMRPRTYAKFSTEGGGTPIFVGSEKEMLLQLQNIEEPGVGTIFQRYGINPEEYGVGGGLRTVGGKLGDEVIAGRGFYESLGDYYSSELHPIALSNVGLQNRLFKPFGSVYDDFRLSLQNPSALFTTTGRGLAVNIVNPDNLSFQDYLTLNTFYGYQKLDKTLFDTTYFKGTEIPGGKFLSEIEFEKISRGGRPFKSGDFLSAGFSDEVFSAHIMAENPPISEIKGFVSSRPRAFGTTYESEVLLPINVKSVRAEPLNATKAFFRKLGFADAYVDVGLEYVPLNYYNVKPTNLQKLLTEGSTNIIEQTKLPKPKEANYINTAFFEGDIPSQSIESKRILDVLSKEKIVEKPFKEPGKMGAYNVITGEIDIKPGLTAVQKVQVETHELVHKLTEPVSYKHPERIPNIAQSMEDFEKLSIENLGKVQGLKFATKVEGSTLKYPLGSIDTEMISRFIEKFPEEISQPTTTTGKFVSDLFSKYEEALIAKAPKIMSVPSNKLLAEINDLSPTIVSKSTFKNMGGYSTELESTFGSKYKPAYNVFERVMLPIVTVGSSSKVYENKYTPTYKPVYSPTRTVVYEKKYEPDRVPVYAPEYEPERTPEYPPNRGSGSSPVYTPTTNPIYTPSYEPKYTPVYEKKYTPKYPTSYQPKYVYSPTYTPSYEPKRTPDKTMQYTKLSPTKKKRKVLEAFDVFERRKGKEVLVARALPRGKAIAKGKEAVFKNAGQTFWLKKVGQTTVADIFTPNYFGLRKPSARSPLNRLSDDVFVQQIKYAISSQGEKQEIPYKAAELRRNKKF